MTILDQTALPSRETYIHCRDLPSIIRAIKTLQVRGAPLIGITSAYAMALVARLHRRRAPHEFFAELGASSKKLIDSRPTAVNLSWALERMNRLVKAHGRLPPRRIADLLLAEARRIHREDAEMCRRIGGYGAALLPRRARIMTICNAGALATGGIGTSLGVIVTAQYLGKRPEVYACETRPLLQGARLTVWELRKHKIPVILICDGAAAATIDARKISCVIAGADRIAANGDTANKIGTRMLADLAHARGIPFFVAAPASTIDLRTPDGGAIPIEQRDPSEVTAISHSEPSSVFNPAFDVTPARLIDAIITDRGVIRPPCRKNIREILKP